jgi:hypothetical protein
MEVDLEVDLENCANTRSGETEKRFLFRATFAFAKRPDEAPSIDVGVFAHWRQSSD